jgi:hypothetical protein
MYQDCEKIKDKITEIALKFIELPENKYYNDGNSFAVSEYLKCMPMQKFMNGLKTCGITNMLEFLNDDKNYSLVFHTI